MDQLSGQERAAVGGDTCPPRLFTLQRKENNTNNCPAPGLTPKTAPCGRHAAQRNVEGRDAPIARGLRLLAAAGRPRAAAAVHSAAAASGGSHGGTDGATRTTHRHKNTETISTARTLSRLVEGHLWTWGAGQLGRGVQGEHSHGQGSFPHVSRRQDVCGVLLGPWSVLPTHTVHRALTGPPSTVLVLVLVLKRMFWCANRVLSPCFLALDGTYP